LRLKGPKILLVDEDVAVLKAKGLVLGVGPERAYPLRRSSKR